MFGLVIIILIIYVLLIEIKNGPVDKTNSRGYHQRDDDIGKMLDRIEWSTLRNNRINYKTRYLLWGLWVTFLGSLLILGDLPSAGIFLRNWIIISIILLSLHSFYYWHSDKFSSFTILKGVESIRDKLNLEGGDLNSLSKFTLKLKGPEAPWTFTHQDYGIGAKFPLDEYLP